MSQKLPQPVQRVKFKYTERFIYYHKSVLHLRKLMIHACLSGCSTDMRYYSVHPVGIFVLRYVADRPVDRGENQVGQLYCSTIVLFRNASIELFNSAYEAD